jgi:hypothetical protein
MRDEPDRDEAGSQKKPRQRWRWRTDSITLRAEQHHFNYLYSLERIRLIVKLALRHGFEYELLSPSLTFHRHARFYCLLRPSLTERRYSRRKSPLSQKGLPRSAFVTGMVSRTHCESG